LPDAFPLRAGKIMTRRERMGWISRGFIQHTQTFTDLRPLAAQGVIHPTTRDSRIKRHGAVDVGMADHIPRTKVNTETGQMGADQ
jgi:hypothetical protein